MKKFILCLLSIFILLSFCGCSEPESKAEAKKIYTETQGNLKITYTYDEWDSTIISKNIYNTDTGLIIEYVYFYERNGWGVQPIGVSVITTTKDGQIIDQLEDKA